MNPYDIIILAIIAILFGLFLTTLSLTVIYYINHATRHKINYQNFQKKIQYFNVIVPDYLYILFGTFVIVSGIFVLFLAFGNMSEYRGYTLSLSIIFLLSILVFQIWKILEYFDEDMSTYIQNYRKVSEAFRIRDNALLSIEKTKQYRSNVLGLITEFERQIASVTDPSEFNLKESISIIDQFVSKQTTLIKQYSEEVISNFDKALESYFEHKVPKSIQLPNIKLDFDMQYDNVRSDIYEKYKVIFNDTLYTLISSKRYNTATIILDGLQILKNNNYKPTQELIELILETIDSIEGSPKSLVDYLLTRNIVELNELTSYAINKKIVWVFKTNLFETQEQLSTVSEQLINEDAHYLALTYITTYFSRLKNVLAFMDKIKESNQTFELFNSYKKVMAVDSPFYSEFKVLENKLMTIKLFYKGKKVSTQLAHDLRKIGNVKEVIANQDQINSIYEFTMKRFEHLYRNAIQSLLMYCSINDENQVLNLLASSTLITDLYQRLLIDDLIVTTILIYSLFIHTNENQELYDEVMGILQTTPEYNNYFDRISLTRKFPDHKKFTTDVIHNLLTKRHRNRLSNILVQIENKRLTLDHLVALY